MIVPAFAGTPEREIFTLAHLPDAGGRGRWGAVLCPPAGHEYVNSFRAFRVLASRLAAQGVAVLRFDYLGTGDSPGEADAGSLVQWRADIACAVDHARDTLGVDRVALVGLRLGATLACQVAGERDDVHRLVLWEPITDGTAYQDELSRAHQAWLGHAEAELPGLSQTAHPGEWLGYRYGDALRHELNALAVPSPPARTSVLLVDEGTGAAAALAARYAGLGVQVTRREVAAVGVWSRTAGMERPTVPAPILGQIVTWLLGQDA